MIRLAELRADVGVTEADLRLIEDAATLLAPRTPQLAALFVEKIANPPLGAARSSTIRTALLEWAHRWVGSILRGTLRTDTFDSRLSVALEFGDLGLGPHTVPLALNRLLEACLAALEDADVERSAQSAAALRRAFDAEQFLLLHGCWRQLSVDARLGSPTTLAAGLAHEIRNPLNAVGLHATLIRRRLRNDGALTEHISTVFDSIHSELRRLGGLTSEIIDFSKPLSVESGWHDVREMLGELRQSHGPAMELTGINFETSVTGPALVRCDRGRLHRVLLQLLDNAVHAVEEVDPRKIAITVDNTPTSTVIVVRDSGPGITPAEVDRAFDIFFTTRAEGTGMGLPLAYKIVRAHRGTIELMSEIGVGTAVRVELPRPATAAEGAP